MEQVPEENVGHELQLRVHLAELRELVKFLNSCWSVKIITTLFYVDFSISELYTFYYLFQNVLVMFNSKQDLSYHIYKFGVAQCIRKMTSYYAYIYRFGFVYSIYRYLSILFYILSLCLKCTLKLDCSFYMATIVLEYKGQCRFSAVHLYSKRT